MTRVIDRDRRAVTPVVGVVLLVTITILLAGSMTFVFAFGDGPESPEFGTPTPDGAGDTPPPPARSTL